MESDLDPLRELLADGGVAVLCGAGLSTESGIPDYRGPTGQLRARLPMTIAEFTGSAAARRRYWARSHAGWRRMAGARPNGGHRALAELQAAGLIDGIITQNVDGLQHAASADPDTVIELHGSLSRVVCLACGARSDRTTLDARLREVNGDLTAFGRAAAVNPDGDVELDPTDVDGFRLVACEACGSDLLKPDVVFFGENVPRPRVQRCFALVEGARSLLVVGSSLTVMSGLRFVHRAAREQIPVAIVNQGVTRGDEFASIRIDGALGDILPVLTAALGVSDRPAA